MKKNTRYGLLLLLSLGVIYLVLRAFGFFTPFNIWTARQDLKKGNIQLIEPGELPPYATDKQRLAKFYGLTITYPGCVVTTELVNGSTYYNRVMIDFLEDKYGKGWRTKFNAQLDSIDHIDRSSLTFIPFTSWTAQQDIKSGTIQLIELGELPPASDKKEELAHIYGFDIYHNGCEVSDALIEGVEAYNEVMIAHLETKYGRGWWAKFQAQLASIHGGREKLPQRRL